ncbi:MAG: hypothetical protein ACI8X5_001674 [Planctomycetota bacterium]|jgi:hypothetical protein
MRLREDYIEALWILLQGSEHVLSTRKRRALGARSGHFSARELDASRLTVNECGSQSCGEVMLKLSQLDPRGDQLFNSQQEGRSARPMTMAALWASIDPSRA